MIELVKNSSDNFFVKTDSILYQKANALVPEVLRLLGQSFETNVTYFPPFSSKSDGVLKTLKNILQTKHHLIVIFKPISGPVQWQTIEAHLEVTNSKIDNKVNEIIPQILRMLTQSEEQEVVYQSEKISVDIMKKLQEILKVNYQLQVRLQPAEYCQYQYEPPKLHIGNPYYPNQSG